MHVTLAEILMLWLALSVVASLAMGRFLAQRELVARFAPPFDR